MIEHTFDVLHNFFDSPIIIKCIQIKLEKWHFLACSGYRCLLVITCTKCNHCTIAAIDFF